MFSKSRFGKGRLFGKKDTSSKKHTSRAWMIMNKKRNEQPELRPRPQDIGVMMSADSSPTLQASVPTLNYVDLPDEPRPGKITPSTNTSNSSPSPRASKSDMGHGSSSPEAEEAIEEAVPIVRSTLPSPEPRPTIEHNGYGKDHDRVDGNNGVKAATAVAVSSGTKQSLNEKFGQRDVDDDSCLIKCVYFTQQCCECTIV